MTGVSFPSVSAAYAQPPVSPVGRISQVSSRSTSTQDADTVILSAAAAQYAQAGESAGLSNVDGSYAQLTGSILNTTG